MKILETALNSVLLINSEITSQENVSKNVLIQHMVTLIFIYVSKCAHLELTQIIIPIIVFLLPIAMETLLEILQLINVSIFQIALLLHFILRI